MDGLTRKLTIVLTIVLLFGSIGFVSAGISQVDSSAVQSDRVHTDQAGPGQSVDVEITVDIEDPTNSLSVAEEFQTDFANAETGEVTLNGATFNPDTFNVSNGEAFVGLGQSSDVSFDAGDTIVISYSVQIPDDATIGAEFEIVGQVGFDGELQQIGTTSITVTDEHPSGVSQALFDAVDQDSNSELTLGEIRAAVDSWSSNGAISGIDATLGDIRLLVSWWADQ